MSIFDLLTPKLDQHLMTIIDAYFEAYRFMRL